MKIKRQIIVFDAADLAAESSFWAGLLGGTVDEDDDWHSVLVDGKWVSAFSSRRTMFPPSGPRERLSKCISTCMSTTSRPRMTRRSHSVRGF